MKFLKLSKDEQRALVMDAYNGSCPLYRSMSRGPRRQAAIVVWPGEKAAIVVRLSIWARQERAAARYSEERGEMRMARKELASAAILERLAEKVRAL